MQLFLCMTLLIRCEVPADRAAIAAFTQAAFLQAPHTRHNEHRILGALRDAGALALSLVAEQDGALVGHVAVSPVSISDGTPGWYGIGPLSVAPAWRGRGMGAQLMQAALGLMKERAASGCVVLGDPAYYARFGFRPAPGLTLPGVPPEHFLALPFGQALPTGAVRYHAAFDMKE